MAYLIDDRTPSPVLFFTPTVLEDSPSYTLEDDLEFYSPLTFDNPGNVSRCLIHSITMVFEFDLFNPHWKCPVCDK